MAQHVLFASIAEGPMGLARNVTKDLCFNDYTFGPASACRQIDVTVEFSNIFFAFLPAIIASAFAVLRTPYLWTKKQKRLLAFAQLPPSGVLLLLTRVVLSLCGIAASAATWALWQTTPGLKGEWSGWLANSLETVTAVLIAIVVILEHFRCSRPSQLPALYLLCSVLLTAARVRTLALIDSSSRVLIPLGLALAARLCLFVSLQISARSSLINGHTLPPTATAGLVSRFLIAWIVPLLWRGYRKPLTMADLGSIDLSLHSINCWAELEPRWIGQIARHREGKTKQPLLRALFLAFKGKMLAPIIPSVVLSFASMGRPLVVLNTVTFVQTPSAPMSTGWAIVGGTFLIYAIYAIANAVSKIAVLRLSFCIRGALMEAIYRKALLVKVDLALDMGSAKASNLMSVDIQNIVGNVGSITLVSSALLQTGIAIYILWTQIGLSFLSAVVGTVLVYAVLPFTTRQIGPARKSWAESTDRRVKFMSSVFRHIKAIKLSAYETYIFGKGIELRRRENQQYRRFRMISSMTGIITASLSSFLSLLVVITQTIITILSGDHSALSTAKIFTVISTIRTVSGPLLTLGQTISYLISAWASFKRIEEFLLQEEKEGAKETIEEEEEALALAETADLTMAKVDREPIRVHLDNATFGLKDKVTLLHDINVRLDNPKLWMIAARVGSGKSTLLHSLLTELDLLSGSIDIHLGRVGFCSQDPWLRNTASIRENITFMAPYEREWYWQVVKAVNLDVDFKEIHEGDMTIASGLSGGQKQRVALARAVYGRFDTLILDDVFSALDADTEAHVFDALFGARGLLNDKAVVLATNQVYRLSHASWVSMLVEGRIAEQGQFSDLIDQDGEMARLVREFVASEKGQAHGEKAIAATVKAEEALNRLTEPLVDTDIDTKSLVSGKEVERGAETVYEGKVKWPTYWLYFKAMGYTVSFFWIASMAVSSIILTCTFVYLQAWTQTLRSNSTTREYVAFIIGYSAMQIGFIACFGLACLYCFVYAPPIAGGNLHTWQLQSVLRAPLDFFESRGAGQLLNRFNTDIFAIDMELPFHLINCLFFFVSIVGSTILVIVAGPYMAAVMAVTTFLLIMLQRFYVRSGRQLKRLDLTSRTPIFSLFGETIDPDGLRTIRAMRAEVLCQRTMTKRATDSQHPAWLTLAVRRWLELALDMFATMINVLLVMIAILEHKGSHAGVLAVALAQAAELDTQISVVIVEWTHAEMAVTSLERIEEYINVPPQEVVKHSPAELDVDVGWLREGSVRFSNVTARYRLDLPAALCDVSFVVKPGQRVGICGRTGSGKSTLLGVLWRLIDFDNDHGRVEVSGVNIRDVSLHEYRSAMSIIPQDPLLLEVSLRENLDPEGLCSDAEIWDALERSQLKEHVSKMEKGLDEAITGDSAAFSRGQRQLLALARAILRHRPILALDEATSSIDAKTDAAIQETLRHSFRDCTVMTIAHRISTIIDYDVIVVMHQGQMVEMGSPAELLSRPQGRFRRLAVESGAVDEAALTDTSISAT